MAAAGAGFPQAGDNPSIEVSAATVAVVATVVARHPSATTMGAIAGALVGFVWGARLGHAVGAVIDERVLGLYRCHDCGEEFKE